MYTPPHDEELNPDPLIIVGLINGNCLIYSVSDKNRSGDLRQVKIMTLKGSQKDADAGAEMRLNMVSAVRPPLKDSYANRKRGETKVPEQYDLLVATCSNNKQAVIWKVEFEKDEEVMVYFALIPLLVGSLLQLFPCFLASLLVLVLVPLFILILVLILVLLLVRALSRRGGTR